MIAAVTAYAIFLQTFIAAAPLSAQNAPPQPVAAPFSATRAAALTAPYSVVLTAVSTEFDAISGIAAYTPSNEIAIAAGSDFELVAANGQHRAYSTAEGLASEARIATARGEAGTFLAGELFAATENRIVRISADGATVQTAWATLPSTESITALTVDRGGAFGGDVVAVTAAGNVWRVNASGTAARLASIGVALGSVTTLADDVARHGPWSARILAGAQAQPMLYAIAADGQVTSHASTVVPRDLAVVTAHENFFGIDPADRKVWSAPAEAFAGLVGDVVVAQSAPGVLLRVHWNGSELESSELARVAQWQQIAFAPAGVAPLKTARRPYDALAVVNHAPVLNSGRIEGALWQLAPESTILDGMDVVTSDLLVSGTPHVAISGSPSFGGTIEGNGSGVPSTHTISITGNATLGHLITRTDAITMAPVAAFTPTANTRDVALSQSSDSPGSFATLRNLTISGKAGAVTVPPGTYGAFSASGRTAFVFGVAGSTTQYELDSLTLAGGSELRLAGPVVLTVNHGVTLTGSTIGAAETPKQLVLRVADGELRVGGKSVLYAVVRAPQSSVIVEGGARLRGTVSCDRLDVSGTIQLTENDVPPPPVNRPPSVDAGADAAVTLPDAVTLRGSASDDGLPAGNALTYQWTRVSGPAEVAFAEPQHPTTNVVFTVPGIYVLRLAASDGQLAASDDVTITVKPQNVAPAVSAGADQSIELPSTASLQGDVTDDGLPQGTIVTTWTRVSGPGTVTFADEHAKATTAMFSVAGTYVLRLTATDGELDASDDVEIRVAPENQPPVVSAGEDLFTIIATATPLNGNASDDGLPAGSTLTTSWSRASGPGEVAFADAAKPVTTATFATAGVYVLRLTATDGRVVSSDDVTITVDPQNAAPVVNAGADQVIDLPATAALNADVTDDGYPRNSQLTLTWSGPASVTFADVHAKETTATFAAAGTYTLTLTVTDGVETTSDDVVIEVRDPNVAPIVDAGPDQTIRLPQHATLAAQVSDDGTQLTITWSGPAGVTFADAHAKNTTATFASAGTYTLTLTADDSKLQSSDELTVTVLPANLAPVATAGPNQTIVLPNVATLQGSAIDDGVPAPLTYLWTGPANVTFADAHAQNTTAAFTTAGTYVLRFTASDGELSSTAEITIEVKANQKPVVDAGADRTANVDEVVTLNGKVTDDGLPSNTLTSQWTVLSGPPPAFADATSPVTTVVFKSAGIYVLRLTASDGALSASDDVTIAVVRPPLADFTVPAISRSAARWTNNLASIAAGASLVSDTSNDGNTGALAIDDNPYTRWRSGNGQNKNQSLTIRLAGNGTRAFDRIRITNDQSATEAVKNFVMQTSMTTADDAAFTTILTSYVNPSRNIQEIELDAPVTAKYVRFTFLDNYGAANMALRDIEVVVPGLGGLDRLGAFNVADSGQGAESVAQSAYVRNPSQALDSNAGTWWHASDLTNAFMTVRLMQQTRVDRVRLRSGATDGARPRDFKVEIAQDLAGPYTLSLTATLANQDDWQEFAFPAGAVRGRFVRLTLINNYGGRSGIVLNDFQVLSADRTSVSSVASPYERPELMFDNSIDSMWSAVGIANEFFIVHLTDGEPRLIDAVELQGYPSSSGESIKDFDVYVSDTTDDDAAFRLVASGTVAKTNVLQRFNFSGGPARARFVKVVAKNNYGGGHLFVPTFHVLTIDHGGNLLSVPGTPPVMTNRSPALAGNGATVIASTGAGVANMLDYFLGEGWISSGVTNQYATIQLAGGNVYTISGVRLAPSYNNGPSPQNFEVWVSSTTADDSAFTRVLTATATTDPKIQNFTFPGGPVAARYVKYVPLTRYGTNPYIHTGLFDVIMPQHPGGAVAASSTSGFNFPEQTLSGNPNLQWVSVTNSNEWVKVAMPDSATRAVYGVFIQPSAFAPRDFEIWTSNTTADDSAFSLVYTGFYLSSQQIYRFGRYVDAKFVKFLFKTSNSTAPFFIRKLDVLTVPDNGAVVLGATSGTGFNANLETVIDVDGGNGAWGSEAPNRNVEQNFTIGLPGAKLWPVDHIAFQQYTPCCSYNAPRDFEVQISTGDGSDASFVTVYKGTSRGDLTTEHCFFPLVSARAVRLLMHNNWGGNAIAIQNFWVFSPQVGPRIARFLDTSVPGARTIVSWAWAFGDGGTSSDRDPVHVFPAPGTYDVALTVTDSDGLSTRRSMQYTVFGDTTADFTISPALPPEQTNAIFNDASTSTNGAILSSEWSFGDGTTNAFGKAVNHTYLDSGQYLVTHKVADVRGVIAIVTKPVTIANVAPIVNAGPDITVPWGQPWNVGAKVSDVVVDNNTITCHWDFGDGTSTDVTDCAKNAAVAHSYANLGTFTATLTATDKDGGTASDSVVTTTTKRPTMITYGGSRGVAADGTISLAAVLRDGISHDLLAGTVTFDVGGQTATAATDASGRATATLVYTGIMNPPVVTVRYDGDARYNASTSTATLSCPANQQPLDVAQVIDLSGSMDTAVPDAKVAFIDLIDSLIPGRDRAATIVFADSAEIRQPLTTDLDAARKAADTFATFGGGTQIASGIYAGMSELTSTRHNPAAQPVLILFSDGGDSGYGVKVAADQAKAAGIRIISIGYKNQEITRQVMEPLASSPSDYYEITSASQLQPLFLSLPGTLCTAPNAAPVVSGGTSQTLLLPATMFTLNGTAVDDGKPAGSTLTYQWTKVSGPGDVTFSAPTSLQTTATMTVAGTYVLRLTASDGLLSAYGEVTCILKPENQAPVVNAGPDLTATIEAELLQNTDAEAALVNGKLPSWTEVAGTWTSTSAMEPFRGAKTFVSSGPSATELMQDVDVTSYGGTIEGGQQKFTWTVFVRVADEAAPDAAKIIVEYRGLNNASILKSVSTNDLSPTGLWERVTSTDVVPQGTRYIRIRLIAARHTGTTNDVWFDAVSLRAVGAGATKLLATATDDQSPSNSLFINWTQTAGPTSGIFNSFRADAHVTVVTPGLHTYRITANDTEKSTSDEVNVTALAANAAPQVNAGADATVQLPAEATLTAAATDESTSLSYTWSFLSGPLGSAIAQPHAQSTSVAFASAGTYVFRVYADDGDRVGVDEVTITVTPPAGNQAPVVNAGADLIVTDPPRTATLNGSATDDGLPEGASLAYAWSTFSGPGSAQFTNPSQPVTAVTFPTAGTYVLRLSCSDTNKIGTDDITVTVVTNKPPVVNAGEDVVFTDSQPIPRLLGTATDNDIPPGGALTYTWTRVSGPGNATIATPAQLISTIALSAHGRHVFRLTATDGQLSASDDVAITWDGPNAAPAVNAGTDQTITLPNTATLDAAITDDGLPVGGALSYGWSRVSGPADVQFANPGAASTTATFTTAGDYVLRITVTDGESTASDDIAITVKEAVPAPVAEITSPEAGTVVTDRTVFTGTVSAGTTWRLEYRANGDDAAASGGWTVIANGSGPFAGILGTIDPTLLRNGSYKVRLIATNEAGDSSSDSIPVAIDGQLKVGLFKLSFTDLSVPLPGMPLLILRSYDSRDRSRIGDFGYGWSIGTNNVRVEKSGVLGKTWVETATDGTVTKTYCLQPGAPRFVTITLPNDKVYRFRMSTTVTCQPIASIDSATVVYQAMPGTRGKLTAAGENDVYVSGSKPGPVELLTFDGLPYNPTTFTLTMEDGTRLVVDELLGLRSMTDRAGNQLTITPDGVTHSAGRGVTFHRDSLHRIERITDPAGHDTTYAYDIAGDLVLVTDPTGVTTRFTYDAKNNLIDYIDSAGRRVARSNYDDAGRLISVTDAFGKTIQLAYDPSVRRETVTDRKGHVLVYEYDPAGHVLSIDDGQSRSTATYDAEGHVLTATNAIDEKNTFTYDEAGFLATVTDHEGHTSRMTYNAFGQLLTATNGRNATTTYEYDDAGRLRSTTDAAGKKVVYGYDARGFRTSITDPDQHVTTWTVSPDGHVTAITSSDGSVQQMTYDALGNVTTSTDAAGHVTTYTYDAAGHLLTKEFPNGETVKYEGDDTKTVLVDVYGNRTETQINTMGLATMTTAPDSTILTHAYDENGNLTGTTASGGLAASLELDGSDHLSSYTPIAGSTTRYVTDALGQVKAETDPRGNTTHYEYNVFRKPVVERDPLGHEEKFGYDAAGNLNKVTTATGDVFTYDWDATNNLEGMTLPTGESVHAAHDWRGQVTSVTDESGRETRYAYTPDGQLATVTEPGGGVTTYEYDGDGRPKSITDASGGLTTMEYDSLGRLVKRNHSDGSWEGAVFAGDYDVATKTDIAGEETRFEYDTMRRPTKVTYPNGDVVTTTYTPQGKPDLVTDARGTTDYDYDPLGRILAVHSPDGTTLGITYDAAGNRATITTVAGTTTYTYDELNRLSAVIDMHGHKTTYEYDDAGNLHQIVYPNGVRCTRGYDVTGRLLSIVAVNAAGETVFSETYHRDATGNVTRVERFDGTASDYEYDDLSRLTKETHYYADATVQRSMAYTYDQVGNRQSISDSASGMRAYTYDAKQHLVDDGRTTFGYDARGNIVSSATGQIDYVYDGRGRLREVRRGGDTQVTYTYDHQGNRIAAQRPFGTTNYVVDATGVTSMMLAETDTAHHVTAAYTFGAGPVSVTRGSEELYYIVDGTGSIRALADASGNVTDRYDYTAFGESSRIDGTHDSTFMFAGEQRDPESGLYFLRSRYYSPAIGRFIQRDHYSGSDDNPQTRNRYAYALNDPVNRLDPSGRASEPGAAAAGKAAHKVIGFYYIARWGDYFFFKHLKKTNKGFPVGLIQNLGYGWGAYDQDIRSPHKLPGKKNGGTGTRPDLRHYLDGDVYEIKPMTPGNEELAVKQATDYVKLLRIYETGTEMPRWDLGENTMPAILDFGDSLKVRSFPFTKRGATLYSYNLLEALKQIVAVAAVTGAIVGEIADQAALEQAIWVELDAGSTAARLNAARLEIMLDFAKNKKVLMERKLMEQARVEAIETSAPSGGLIP